MKNEYNSGEYIYYQFSTNSRGVGANTTKQWLITFIHHLFLQIALRNLETLFYKSRRYLCQDYRECTGGIEISPQVHSLIQTLREVKHLEDYSFIFTVYKQNFDFGKQQFHLIILEAEEAEPGDDDIILYHYPRAQQHERLRLLLNAAKQYFDKCSEQFQCLE
ncbi:Hypothetical_protein [Hexamita inflata]|uniref:Hypothetical_protein n=1 Tax=Hexamita inflata TaxID=28002 RepID=A0AA86QTX2_9EUKA|nr:Hypothetical protein HINF_LOCUS53631 [Hexamita inflata]CAI9965990.1 Hypothetical protein HINF_LOCUS53635 [Hexamita inflata]